jgi:hypothetical protein
MQNDLISRSALLEAYHEMGISMNPDVFEEDVEELINNQPCAYDVEKVERQLYTESFCYEDLDGEGYYLELGKALWIVSNGGKE